MSTIQRTQKMFGLFSISISFIVFGISKGLQSDHRYTHTIHKQWVKLEEDQFLPKHYNDSLTEPLHRKDFSLAESLNQDGFSHRPAYDNLTNYHSHWGIDDKYSENSIVERDPKFLSLFTVVRFTNSACTGGGDSGTCYTARECQTLGGRSIGPCAHGFGTCCYQQITCGGSTSQNCTYLVSPNYPNTYNTAQTCTMQITRSSDTCQLRMDFDEFDSVQPDEFGVCNEDQFTVDGETKFTYLCGTAPSDWHFYLDVSGKANPTVFNFLTTSTSFNRRFKIKITQVPCGQKIPCGCGQYFRENSGTIQSWNYPDYYPAGVDYGICFRKEKGTCTTTLERTGPSFVACPDLYRQPVGEDNGSTAIGALDVMNLYCQLPCAVAALASICTLPSPVTTINNGPLIIHHQTSIETVGANHFNQISGFSQSFSHNTC